jgi:signal peptidase II
MKRRLPYILVLIALVAADLLSKDAVFTRLRGYEDAYAVWGTIDVIDGFFRLCIVRNPGATFGLGKGYVVPLSILNMGAIILLSVLYWRCRPGEWLKATSLVLILAGAFGNLYDRVKFHWVRDFLDVYVSGRHWPPFNVADACIVVGVIVLAVILWRTPSDPKKDEA